jgi:hypothetical protein
MALLNSMIRNVAITGRTAYIDEWLAGRQGGRWALQTVRAAMPTAASRTSPPRAASPRPPADRADRLRSVQALHDQGIVTEAEVQRLRAQLGV